MWWTWTAPSTGAYVIQTVGSNFDTLLAVYTGTAVNALTARVSDDDSGGNATSLVTLSTTAGVVYQIAVDGYSGASGSISLTVIPPVDPPSNDNFASRTNLVGAPAQISGTNAGASKESGEPSHAGYAGGRSVWYSWTAPSTGECSIWLANASFSDLLGIYTGSSVNTLNQISSASFGGTAVLSVTSGVAYQIAVDGYNPSSGTFTLNISAVSPPPPNDAFANRLILPPNTNSISGANQGATKEAGEPNHAGYTGGKSVWYSWTAPTTGECTVSLANTSFPPVLGIYTGQSVNTLSQVGSGAFGSAANFQVTAGTSYHFAVDGYNSNVSGTFTLNIGNVIPPPANDSFAARMALPSGETSTTGSTSGATKEAGEPNHAGQTGGKSVWWSWVAPSTGEVTLQISGNSFNPLMGVYVGDSVAGLTAAGVTSSGTVASFFAVAGWTYQIAVDTASFPSGGGFTLSISAPAPPPPNDNFANRPLISGTFAKASGSNNGSSKEFGEPNHAGSAGGRSVWYRWIAPSTGTFNLYLLTSGTLSGYGVAAIYTGNSVNALTLVVSSPGGNPSVSSFAATAGIEYQIAVDGGNPSPGITRSGPYILNISQLPANNTFASAVDLGSVSNTTSASWIDFGTNTEAGEPGNPIFFWLPTAYRTIWWKWTAPASGLFNFDTLSSDFDTVIEVYTGAAVNALTKVADSHDADTSGHSSLALNATLGTTYYFRILGETVNEIGNAVFQVSQLGSPGNISQHIALGRAYLQQQDVASLANADSQFASALAIDANHPEANFLKALTSLARLEQGAAFDTALAGLGLTNNDLYRGRYSIPVDANGNKIAAPGSHTSYGLDYLVNTVLPHLAVVRSHLDKASGPAFQTTISDRESNVRFAKVDAGDVSLIRASTYMAEALIRLLQTYDIGVSMSSIVTQSNQQDFTAETFLNSFSNLLQNTANDQRTALKQALQNANTHYQAGSNHIRTLRANPADPKACFYLKTSNQTLESDARLRAQESSDALNGNVLVAGKPTNLSQAISGPNVPLRSRLPAAHGNQVVASTTPDPTFGGSLPQATQTQINNQLRSRGLLFETSTFGNWSSHFLQGLSPADQVKSADPDGDMLSNFAEYAFNLDPARRSIPSDYATSGLATNVVDNKPYLNIIYNRRIVRNAINYVVAVSDNLSSWDRTQAQLIQVGQAVPNPDGVTESVQFRVLADPSLTSRKFIRVEVTDLTP